MLSFFFTLFGKWPDVVLQRFAPNFCVSPLPWWYMVLLGEYHLTKDKPRNNAGVLPPTFAPRIIPEN